MIRTLSLFAVLAAFTLTVGVRADDEKKPKRPGGRDPEMMFKKLDANNDGKLSKDEFKKVVEMIAQRAEKLKDKPELVDKLTDRMFEKLDENKNGSLSAEEFKKITERLGELRKNKGDK